MAILVGFTFVVMSCVGFAKGGAFGDLSIGSNVMILFIALTTAVIGVLFFMATKVGAVKESAYMLKMRNISFLFLAILGVLGFAIWFTLPDSEIQKYLDPPT